MMVPEGSRDTHVKGRLAISIEADADPKQVRTEFIHEECSQHEERWVSHHTETSILQIGCQVMCMASLEISKEMSGGTQIMHFFPTECVLKEVLPSR